MKSRVIFLCIASFLLLTIARSSDGVPMETIDRQPQDCRADYDGKIYDKLKDACQTCAGMFIERTLLAYECIARCFDNKVFTACVDFLFYDDSSEVLNYKTEAKQLQKID